ncbi:tissue factor pathway inhibitor-like [Oncorhynchus nerka]|uniref:tissue factor pathway inhibitor-like n=1 Tax=Oncorhynchus nerka TaxID=8023 RepID=UPI001130A1D1|nr:tissue factor pathway inhibitor-like [Oncorhynchus nerka]
MAYPLLHVFLLGVMLPIASSMKPFCSSKMDEGKAMEGKEDDKQLQYYYNEGKGACFPFFYKGLEGNENRFNTDRQCMNACSDKFEELYPAADGVCGLPVDHGSCFAMLLMHYYNAEEGNCRVFHYSGCQGNGNRFETREQCLQTCMAKAGRFGGAMEPGTNPDESSTNAGLIVGILGGIVFAVAVISAIVLFVVQRKEKSRKGSEQVPTLEMK